MEFERRTKRGKAADAARQAREEADRAELQGAQMDADAMQQGQRAREEAGKEQDGSEEHAPQASTSATPFSAEETLHNLDVAQRLIASGQDRQASAVPLRMAAIRIEGAKSLRPSFLGQLCRPYMDASLRPTGLNQLLYAHRLGHVLPGQYASLSSILGLTASIGGDLTSLDLFSDISASLQPAQVGHSVEDVDVVLSCKEKGNYFLKTSTDVGNGEGNATVQGRIRNLFGGAERAELSAMMGTKTRRAFSASIASPLFASPDHNISLAAFAQDRDLTSYASLIEGVRGVRLALQLQSPLGSPLSGSHELGLDVTHRHLSRLLPTASLSIKRLAGHSIKSSLSHLYTRDTRDDPFTATQGHYLKVLQEYAGLGGDAQHYKVETEAQMSRTFAPGWAYSLAAQGGLLRSLTHASPLFCDRFQLGGPVSLRMFRFNSLGPKDGLDSLGGDVFYSLGASLFAPIPRCAHWPLKVHAFGNIGQLIQLDATQSLLHSSNQRLLGSELFAKPSSSIGVGLMYRQGNLRAEINFGLPVTMRAGDGARKGVQLGIGVSFM